MPPAHRVNWRCVAQFLGQMSFPGEVRVQRTAKKKTRVVEATEGQTPSMRRGIKRPSTVDLVADELRRRIIAGELAEGEQLLQAHLATDLGVSRIPVREALRQLEAEGLVTISSHRGGIVSELSLAEIEELFETRGCLETWLLSLALPKMTNADLQSAENIARQMLHGEVERWGEMNWKFHEALYAPARRPQTMLIIKRIHHNIDRYLRLQVTLTAGRQKAQQEHLNIVALCRAKNVRKATAALNAHVNDAAKELIEKISEWRSKSKAHPAGR
jgi:DNA-binding GntR family transcriptional regulator